mgnify:CR=1 FL=1
MKRTHIDLFDDNSWGWVLSNATITGGVADITSNLGNIKRTPNSNWYSGSTDDFITEINWKMDTDVAEIGQIFRIKLVGDENEILFHIHGTTYDKYKISHGGVEKASSSPGEFNPAIGVWYTAKLRRVGTTYYFRPAITESEISWNYGTQRVLEYIRLSFDGCTGEFDNFKYYPIEIPSIGIGVGNPLIL